MSHSKSNSKQIEVTLNTSCYLGLRLTLCYMVYISVIIKHFSKRFQFFVVNLCRQFLQPQNIMWNKDKSWLALCSFCVILAAVNEYFNIFSRTPRVYLLLWSFYSTLSPFLAQKTFWEEKRDLDFVLSINLFNIYIK